MSITILVSRPFLFLYAGYKVSEQYLSLDRIICNYSDRIFTLHIFLRSAYQSDEGLGGFTCIVYVFCCTVTMEMYDVLLSLLYMIYI